MSRERYYWLNEQSRDFLSKGYISGKAEDRILQIANKAEQILGISGFAEKFENYMALGYYSLSTPVWVNFGIEKGLPISCYGTHVEDTMSSILDAAKEIGMMSKFGGGTSLYLGDIRPRGQSISSGGKADGPVHYSLIYDSVIKSCKQADARRGACALYLPVEHSDILEFLKIQSEGNPIQALQFGVSITDEWLESAKAGDKEKGAVWAKILETRSRTGLPYILFKDNVNNNTPYKELGYTINASNLCTEIMLPSDAENSFVCCIGSINLLHWDEIKNTDAIETYTMFLNAVLNEFVSKTESIPSMWRAHNFAKNHRAIGVGVLGYHSYLQENLVPFESLRAKSINNEIFKTLKERTESASKWLHDNLSITSIRPGFANTTLVAIAPTKSSSYILGQVSMGIEPIKSNIFIKDLAKGKTEWTNPKLISELEKYGLNTSEVWESIIRNDGSVQHLDFPTKEVFKSFVEISPMEIILQAGLRQEFIDQGQSVNVMIESTVPSRDISKLHLKAHELGLKSLYYQYSQSAAQKFTRSILECVNCEA
jgi:ribonucleoside-diphosphate reductase alpha chain